MTDINKNAGQSHENRDDNYLFIVIIDLFIIINDLFTIINYLFITII